MERQTRETCRHWRRGCCRFGANCQDDHFEHRFPNRGRSVLDRDSPRTLANIPRPDTPIPAAHGSHTPHPEAPEGKGGRDPADAANTLPRLLASTPTEEAPSSTPKKESFIYVDSLTGSLRFLKIECDIIRQVIEENYLNYDLNEYEILQMASDAVLKQAGTARLVADCWTYWLKKGRQESHVARDWPAEPEDVDENVMMSRRINITTTSTYAVTPDEAALRKTPTAIMVSATKPIATASALWPKEQKEFLCKVIKEKKNDQYHMSRQVFWQEVGEDMHEAGYPEGYQLFRDYWDKQGRQEFNYDEKPYFDKRPTTETVKRNNTTSRTNPPGIRYNADQKLPRDEDYTPKKGTGRRSSYSTATFQGSGKSTKARRRSLTPEDSPIQPIKNRKRASNADEHPPPRPTKKRVPSSSPKHKSPKACVPQRIESVIHNMRSNYHVKDNTAKVASQFPLELQVPTPGEKFCPSFVPKEITLPEPSRKTVQPVAPSTSHDTLSKIFTTEASATQQSERSPRKPSQPPARKVSKKASAKDTESQQPDTRKSVQPSNNDSAKATQPFDFRALPQMDFAASPEPMSPVSPPTPKKVSISKNASKQVTQSTEQKKTGFSSLAVSQTARNADALVKSVTFFEPETPQSFSAKQLSPVRKQAGSVRGKEVQTEVKPGPIIPDSAIAPVSNTVPGSAVAQTPPEVGIAIPSIVTCKTDKYGHQHHLFQGQKITHKSNEDTIFVEDNRPPTKVITRAEESALVPSATASTRSRLSATPSLTDDQSSTSDEQMVDVSQPSQATPMDWVGDRDEAEAEAAAHLITKKMLRETLEYTESQISNIQKDVLKIQGEKTETEKKLSEIELKINTLVLARDAMKGSHAGNMVELQRLEEKLEETVNYKRGLIICIESKEDA
ncbi:hypothetical protein SBOR_0920 [Sclerotinia borealis F-4128]|uniref:C3H1-type domain-containing protein n=1 Tax=Sclerotinia borealis (strain F-4128) TaxID=1432307 RepID=W9CPC5_SCLBF|nr:hypothetical protein SBOR_0920 [Sclerotinia borealis F-4128]